MRPKEHLISSLRLSLEQTLSATLGSGVAVGANPLAVGAIAFGCGAASAQYAEIILKMKRPEKYCWKHA
jgi:hypothetical protein